MSGPPESAPAQPAFRLSGEELELLELAVSWAIIGQRPAGEAGQLLGALVALRRRLRAFHFLHNEWVALCEGRLDTDSPF